MQNPFWCWCFTCLGFASVVKPDQWKCLKPYSSLSRKRLPRGKHEQRERERTTRGNARRARWTNLPSRVETPLNPEASLKLGREGEKHGGKKQSERKHTVKSRMVKFSNRWSSPRLHSLSHGISATSDCGIVESESNASHPSLNPKRPKNKRKRKETQAPTVWFPVNLVLEMMMMMQQIGGQAGRNPSLPVPKSPKQVEDAGWIKWPETEPEGNHARIAIPSKSLLLFFFSFSCSSPRTALSTIISVPSHFLLLQILPSKILSPIPLCLVADLFFLSKTLSHYRIQFSLLQTFAFPSDTCEVPPHFESMGGYVRTMSAFGLDAFRFSYKQFLWELGAKLLQLLTLLQHAWMGSS